MKSGFLNADVKGNNVPYLPITTPEGPPRVERWPRPLQQAPAGTQADSSVHLLGQLWNVPKVYLHDKGTAVHGNHHIPTVWAAVQGGCIQKKKELDTRLLGTRQGLRKISHRLLLSHLTQGRATGYWMLTWAAWHGREQRMVQSPPEPVKDKAQVILMQSTATSLWGRRDGRHFVT